MTGFILAAGLGTRLRPITNHIPKALAPVCGIPLVAHARAFLREHGIQRLGVNTHHHAAQIESFVKNEGWKISLFHERDNIRGTGGALYFARTFLCDDSMFCICNADILLHANLRELFESFEHDRCIAALVAAPARNEGTIRFDIRDRRYLGTHGQTREGMPADFVGLAMYRREFLELVNEDDFSIVPVWQRAVDKGHVVRVFLAPDMYWRDTGTPSSLAQIHFDVLDGMCRIRMAPALHVDWKERRAYPRALADNARAGLGAHAWCNSTAIEPGARVRRSVVFDSCTVPSDADIVNSLVTPWGTVSCD